jgi:asparagine synthase (glutamine-hydrolysing)
MCGIVGKWNFRTGVPVEHALIRSMAGKIAHRGPDDEGVLVQGALGIGFRRLAIIDLSPAGHQPMSNEDGTVWIVFNGEIYNYNELRPDLERRGHTFRSRTDTETIVHLYEEYGEQCVNKLRGMFAFAIWDARKEQLFLARDRVGKKPLKYYLGPDGITFASELKAILADPSVPRDIDMEAVDAYLTYQYVPHPRTGFRDIQKLPPAHTLTIRKGKVELQRYWQLDFSKKETRSEGEWCEAIREKLNEAVKIRLMSDVPLGAFLSGGVDSSAVVAFMAKNSSSPVKTFSIGFREQSHNELPYARLVARMYGTDHTEFIVEPKALEILPKLVYQYEEPYADSSAIPSYYVAQQTRQHVTVALNGDGGDENFAGYPWYPVHAFASRYALLPKGLQAIIAGGAHLALHVLPSTATARGWRFARGVGERADQRYLRYMAYFHPDELLPMLRPEHRTRYNRSATEAFLGQYFSRVTSLAPVDQALFVDIATYLPDDLLAKVDIATMAVSLEGRSPFLDHEFMEFAATIPADFKIHRGEKKYILKRALEGLVPHENLYRKKMGFSVPLVHWFRHELHAYLEETLFARDAFVLTLFQETELRSLLKEHLEGKVDHANRLWSLLTLEMWHRTFFRNYANR